MNIGVPNQCMTDVQFEIVDENMHTVKYDAGCCFIPDYYGYWISYLVERIQNGQ